MIIQKGYKIFKSIKKVDVSNIIIPTNTDLLAAANTYPKVISRGEIGADKISYIVPLNLGKYIPNEALEMLWFRIVSIIKPGTKNEEYSIPSIFSILEPIADPKTIK